MSSCEEYVSRTDAENMVRHAVKENSAYYIAEIERLDENWHKTRIELARRYERADRFLRYIKKKINGKETFRYLDFELPLTPDGDPLGIDEIHEIDKLLQTGFDFRLLLKTIKEDETLSNQWKGIMMTMKLSGYDEFQADGEAL
jgi:hypothetical protein